MTWIRVAATPAVVVLWAGLAFGQDSFDVRVVVAEGDPLAGASPFASAPFESLRVASDGTVTFLATLEGGGQAVLTDRDGTLEVVAQTGEPAPGTGAFFGSFFTIKYAGDRTILVRAGLAGGDLVDCNNNGFAENDHGLWRDAGEGLELILREDDPLPGADPFRAALIGNTTASPFGAAFGSFVSTRTGTCPFFTEDNSIYMLDRGGGLGPLVIPGEPSPVEEAAFGTTANDVRFAPADPGAVTFTAELAGRGFFEGNDLALVKDQAGQRTIRLLESDPVPGFEGLTIGPIFRTMSLRDDKFTWIADLRTPEGDFTFREAVLRIDEQDTLEVLAVEGEPAPLFPGASIVSIGAFDPPGTDNGHTIGGADDNSTAFRARISGQPVDDDQLIYHVDAAGSFSVVIREGDTPPGYTDDFAFEVSDIFSFLPFHKPFMNRLGQIAFVGRIAGPGVIDGGVLYFFDPAVGEVRKVLGPGDTIDLAGDGSDAREVVTVVGFGPIGQAPTDSPFTDAGHMVFPAVVEGGPDGQTNVVLVAQPSPSPPCPGDLNSDGVVGIQDLFTLFAAWGQPDADLDGDGTTGIGDLLILFAAWGPCA